MAEVRYSALSGGRAVAALVSGNDLTYAASIAYYALLSLFPFLLLLISALGVVVSGDAARATVLGFIFQYFPNRMDFVADQLASLDTATLRFGVAGGLALVWASLGVFGAVTSAVNAAWGVETPRSFLKHRLVSFLMLVASGGVLLAALALASASQVVGASWFGGVLGRYGWMTVLRSWSASYATTALLILGVGFVFYFIPNAKTRLRDVWVGAIVTGLLWRGAFSGFAWYVSRNQGLAFVQGTLFAVVVFLMWVYLSAVILMFGVEFTASYARLRRGRSGAMPAAATPR